MDILRVAFDLTPVISGRTGIARYVTELDHALAGENAELRRFAVGRNSFPVPPGTRHVKVPARLASRWWGLVGWPPIEMLTGPADLVHATGLFLPSTKLPLVVTVHDLGALAHPELHPARQVAQKRELLRTVKRASAILTVSAATAHDLEAFGVARDRVVISPLGLTPLPPPVPIPTNEAPAPGHLLTVGEGAPRKNYPIVLEALRHLPEEVTLVMVGPPGADEQRIGATITELGLGRRVKRLGAVDDGVLAWLYERALALCFPSLTEGFGLPVLEAMASGTPVLASDIPATRELAGPDAMYVPEPTPEAWAQAIQRLRSADTIRSDLARAGPKRAASYTWSRTAEATIRAYQLALEAGPASVGR